MDSGSTDAAAGKDFAVTLVGLCCLPKKSHLPTMVGDLSLNWHSRASSTPLCIPELPNLDSLNPILPHFRIITLIFLGPYSWSIFLPIFFPKNKFFV